MTKFKKISALVIAVVLLAFSSRAMAEDAMQSTVRDSLYGGLIGALVGGAVMMLTDHPSDHVGYIPTGAAVGILAGAAYGLSTNTIVHSAAEVNDGRLTFNLPTVKVEEHYDKKLNNTEKIESIDLLNVKF